MSDPQPPQDDFASLRRDLHLLATAHAEVSDALGQGLLSTHTANKGLMRAVQSLTAVVQVMNERLDELERRQARQPRSAD